MAHRLGVDVGGTFTDFVLQSPAGGLLTGKRLTTYPDPSRACLEGLDELELRAAVSRHEVFARVTPADKLALVATAKSTLTDTFKALSADALAQMRRAVLAPARPGSRRHNCSPARS